MNLLFTEYECVNLLITVMSCRDKHVIAWKSFEIGNGILYTEDDVKKYVQLRHY